MILTKTTILEFWVLIFAVANHDLSIALLLNNPKGTSETKVGMAMGRPMYWRNKAAFRSFFKGRFR